MTGRDGDRGDPGPKGDKGERGLNRFKECNKFRLNLKI